MGGLKKLKMFRENAEDTNILSGPQRNFPDIPFADYLLRHIKRGGEKIAQIDGITNKTTTYNELLHNSVKLALCMQDLGLSAGDVISICSENRLEFVLPVLASLYLGVTIAPLNFSYIEREINHAVAISKPCVVFCSSKTLERILVVANQNKFIKKIIVFDKIKNTNVLNIVETFEQLLNRRNHVDVHKFKPVQVKQMKHVAVILCSSGTTGLPKGVMLTHYNMLVAIETMIYPKFRIFKEDSVVLGILPMFHAYGFMVQLGLITVNAQLIVLPRFIEKQFLKSIEYYKITHLFLVPPIVLFLAKSPLIDEYDVSSLQEILCGAAPLSGELIRAVLNRLKMKILKQGYGMTELSFATLLHPADETPRYASVGTLAPNTLAKVIDIESGRSLEANKEGELCFKGPLVMKGYKGNRQATSVTIDQDGWLHTGDIGYYDNTGYFYIVDRVKELIKYKGYQVAPAELEAILLKHPGIKDAAVIGVPDDIAGELPLAFVVKQIGANLTEQGVTSFVSDFVSPQKRLHGGVKFVDEIPKNPSGKILRRELRALIAKRKSHL